MTPPHDDSQARIEQRRADLMAACLAAGDWVSGDGRVVASTVARLLGYSEGTLANMRLDGSGPPWGRLGGAGHRVTYCLRGMAAWIEERWQES
jgi:hypothetical protein